MTRRYSGCSYSLFSCWRVPVLLLSSRACVCSVRVCAPFAAPACVACLVCIYICPACVQRTVVHPAVCCRHMCLCCLCQSMTAHVSHACESVAHVAWGVCFILPCVAQPRHVSFEPAWAVLEHELAAQIHISMKQYFARLKQVEPDNAFRPDTLVCLLRSLSCVCA